MRADQVGEDAGRSIHIRARKRRGRQEVALKPIGAGRERRAQLRLIVYAFDLHQRPVAPERRHQKAKAPSEIGFAGNAARP